ncbi:MAG TPA: chorismate mutase, partial [Micromonosporaceae bacterium]|nr:chorismate mutase [Micromonosporaceae bacterium]
MIDVNPSILSAPADDATPAGGGAPGATGASGASGASGATVVAANAPTNGPGDDPSSDRISGLRERIDEIDNELIRLWQERAAISAEVGRVRIASGGTRLVLSREREIVDRFRDALGAD